MTLGNTARIYLFYVVSVVVKQLGGLSCVAKVVLFYFST